MMNILDTSRAITEHTVKWLPPNPKLPGTSEIKLFALNWVQMKVKIIVMEQSTSYIYNSWKYFCNLILTYHVILVIYLGVDVPQEVDLYSLVQGRTELILFGGLKRDISIRGAPPNHSTRDSSSVTNNLHILYPQIQNI